jgi:hypothetical protein
MARFSATPIEVVVINASNFVKKYLDDHKLEMQDIVDALQEQVTEHFRPVWGIDAHLTFLDGAGPVTCLEMLRNYNPGQGSWWLVIVDHSDIAGYLGYHDLTHEGLPLGKVFAGTDSEYGLNWTVSASRELLEMLADPAINRAVISGERLYAYDVCGACRADQYVIGKYNVAVSNFVYPAWFEGLRSTEEGARFDHLQQIRKPFELRPGGYIDVFDLNPGTGWYQLFAGELRNLYNYRMRPLVGSREEKRRTDGSLWMNSALPGKEIPPVRPKPLKREEC